MRLCPHCLEYGFREALGPKILLKGRPRREDYDNWLQCYACGKIYPKYENKMESELSSVIEPSTSPYDESKIITGLGNKRKKNRHQNKFEKIKERIEKEKDQDIRAELNKGNIVEVIEDSLNY